ncbi:MAG TPA: hypothetical protein EYG82_01605 [Sulfurovum sp.]|nr:hypothetical protein [Sulfurovum sp.]
MKYVIGFCIALILNACIANSDPHQSFKDGYNNKMGKKWNPTQKRLNAPNKGKLNGARRYGYGLTDTTRDKDNNYVFHISEYECIKNPSLLFYEQKGIIGHCKTYLIVDPKTKIMIDWGFDRNSNPRCCRVTG